MPTRSPCRDCADLFCPWPRCHRPKCRRRCPLLAEFKERAAASRDPSYGVADPTDDGYNLMFDGE